jgi:hypothetical protein
MGMFTTIIPDEGPTIQIKCGYDDCDTYRMGQVVDYCPDLKRPGRGKLPDDAYLGIVAEDGDWLDRWVIIKDHKVHAIRDRICLDPPEERSYDRELHDLRVEFDVWGFPHQLWSEEQWEETYVKSAEERTLREATRAAKMAELMKSGKNREEAAAAMAAQAGAEFLMAKMHEPSIGAQILQQVEIDD